MHRVWISVLAIASAGAQAATPVAFETASIKLAQPGAPRSSLTSNPGRWSCTNCSLFALLTQAFTAFDYQFAAPDWTRTTMMDVVAKLPEGAKREDVKLMLQNLLEERLHMKTHRE